MFGSLNPTQWKRLTATGLVKTGQGQLTGLLCASSSSMTATVYDGIDSTGVLIVNTMSLTAATPYPMPAKFNVGCYIVIGGTGDLTVFYD